jgi:nucleoside-diphosphate-sugar epimerase
MSTTVVITGAFSYTGKYTTRLLLERGLNVRTLTGHPPGTHAVRGVTVFPYNFDCPAELERSLAGASTLINTYWVRFPRRSATFEAAVDNSRTLIHAARDAGVRRIVHVSIANPSLFSHLGYYKGKALVEQAVRESGLPYCILRPTVIFGKEDILINNIAWFIRNLPIFGIPGDGKYGVRPIHVEDMAKLLADAIYGEDSAVTNAVGPETYSFEELVRLIARSINRPVRPFHVPAPVAYASTKLMGWLLRDVVLTWEEYKGLMDNLLAPEGPATGKTRLSEWLTENAEKVGSCYASEVARHYDLGR